MLSRIGGVIVRIKKDTKPETPNDGELIGDFDRSFMTTYKTEPYVIDNLEEGAVYWVRCFPYSDHNVISYADNWSFRNEIKGYHIFGFHQDFTNLDPETCITYIADNKDWTPINGAADVGPITLGSWATWDWLNKVRPFMIKREDLTVDYALDPNDYSKKLDGSPSDISDRKVLNDAYVWFPKLYIKEVYAADGNSRDVYFTDTIDFDETKDFKNQCFRSIWDSNERQGIWIAMFYPSRSTQPYAPSKNMSGFTGREDNIDDVYSGAYSHLSSVYPGYYGRDIGYVGAAFVNFIRDVLYMLCRSTNIQNHIGMGYRTQWNNQNPPQVFAMGTVLNGVNYLEHGAFYGNKNTWTPAKAFHCFTLASYCRPIGYYGAMEKANSRFGLTGPITLGARNIYTYVSMPDISTSQWYFRGFPTKMKYTDCGSIPVPSDGGSVETGLCDYMNISPSSEAYSKQNELDCLNSEGIELTSIGTNARIQGPSAISSTVQYYSSGNSWIYHTLVFAMFPYSKDYTPYD